MNDKEPEFGSDAVVGPWGRATGARRAGDRARKAGRLILIVPFVGLLLAVLGTLPLMGSHWWMLLLLAAGMFLLMATIMGVIVLSLWRPWSQRCPGQPVGDDAEVRLFQFVTLGVMGGFNGCVEIARDRDFVHLRLMPPFSWCGASPISLPLAELRVLKRGGAFVRGVRAEIGGRRLTLPGWVLPE